MFSDELKLTGFDGDVTEELAEATVRKYCFFFNPEASFCFMYKGEKYWGVPQEARVVGHQFSLYTGKIRLYKGNTLYGSKQLGVVYTTH